MNRGQIVSRVQKRSDRTDSDTKTLIQSWVDEVIETVEQLYPFSYIKRSETTSVNKSQAEFTLPTDLILRHQFTMRLHSTTTPTTYTKLVNIGDRNFYTWITSPDDPEGSPLYWMEAGGTDGLVFRLYPVPDEARTLELTGGYFYSGAFTADADTSWLATYHEDICIEGVSAKLFEHYQEFDRADRAFRTYNAFLNGDEKQGIAGLIPAERRKTHRGRHPRVKTLDDFPLAYARRLRNLGY